MPPRDDALRLHIVEAISRIRRYTASHTLESFAVDDMVVDAVVRNLEVIGEAARHVDEAQSEAFWHSRLRTYPQLYPQQLLRVTTSSRSSSRDFGA